MRTLTLIEDSDEDSFVFAEIVAGCGIPVNLVRMASGEEFFAALERAREDGDRTGQGVEPVAFLPDLVMLDLNLNGMDGREVLARIKADARTRSLPVIVLSTSDNPKDVTYCYDRGANCYLLKPVDLEGLERTIRLALELWARSAVLPKPETRWNEHDHD